MLDIAIHPILVVLSAVGRDIPHSSIEIECGRWNKLQEHRKESGFVFFIWNDHVSAGICLRLCCDTFSDRKKYIYMK